jgi:hypothetical protein
MVDRSLLHDGSVIKSLPMYLASLMAGRSTAAKDQHWGTYLETGKCRFFLAVATKLFRFPLFPNPIYFDTMRSCITGRFHIQFNHSPTPLKPSPSETPQFKSRTSPR